MVIALRDQKLCLDHADFSEQEEYSRPALKCWVSGPDGSYIT